MDGVAHVCLVSVAPANVLSNTRYVDSYEATRPAGDGALPHGPTLPLPAVPTLMTVSALAKQSPYQIAQITLAAVSGALISELALYWCGRRYGHRFLGLLCRLSFSPDFCVRRTEEVFARIGSWSLLLSKFITGLTLITVAMAGVSRMPVLAFLLLDGIGAALFISATVTVGVLFHDAITSVLLTLANLGKIGGLIVLAALVLYALTRWWRGHLLSVSFAWI